MATTQSAEPIRQTVGGRVWQLVVFAACAWGAALVVPGVELTGSLRRQAIVVVALSFFDQLVSIPSRHLSRASGQAGLNRRFQRFRRLGCLGHLGILVTTVLGGPIAWWLTARLAEALSLPFQVNGFWPLVLAPLATAVLSWLPIQAPRVVTETTALRPLISGQVLRVLATIGGFVLLLAFGVIGFEAGTWWATGICLVVLACLYHLPGLHVDYTAEGWPRSAVRSAIARASAVALPLVLVVNGFMLQVVAWLSPYIGLRMYVDGFWNLVVASALLLAMAWTASALLAARRMRRLVAGPEGEVYASVRVARHGYVFGHHTEPEPS